MDKKVLIITYYWPPAGGPGVQRWLKFVKYLPDFGIQPIVYIPDNPEYPTRDEILVDEVSPKAIIIRKKILEPYSIAAFFSGNKIKKISSGIIPNKRKQTFSEKLALWIRGNLFIPDARVFWVAPSVKFLRKYIAENNVETIITSGPPHSLHLIGLRLKKQMNVKWIADFRDPWTTIGYHSDLKLSKYAQRKHKKMESDVLRSANQILVTSNTTKSEFSKLTNKPIHVITNGYDLELPSAHKLDAKFSIAHIGSLLSQRNPVFLWEVLAEIIREVPTFAGHFEFKLIGNVSRNVRETISAYKLDAYVNAIGYVSHREAVSHQRASQVLLLVEINSAETKSIIPGKLFEYMVSGRPIIGIGPTGSDFAEIIKNTNTGIYVDYSERAALKSAILKYYSEYLQGTLKSEAVGLQQYSRKNLTKKLAELLNG